MLPQQQLPLKRLKKQLKKHASQLWLLKKIMIYK